MRIFDFLFPPRADELELRNYTDDEFLSQVSPRLVPETRPGTVALLTFSNAAVRAALHEAKYHGSERAFSLLGSILTEYIRDADDVGRRTSHTYLVPIPLGKARRKERGFNQVEEIVKRTASELHITIDGSLLIRTRETESQVSLAREKRRENMRGAFRATRSVDPNDTYIVIDDVITTGATLQAAIDALTIAGATHIIPIALAH